MERLNNYRATCDRCGCLVDIHQGYLKGKRDSLLLPTWVVVHKTPELCERAQINQDNLHDSKWDDVDGYNIDDWGDR